ncbi:CHAT domain-containing protein [Calothrix sp. CCY 0018]|uniref:CHAT domain-containing protein n=1 Tax=Calothrix sp. CCY 0018 TaxID=3103864 RepID=UPI0039C7243B
MSESKYNLSNAKFGGGFAEGTQIGGTLNDYSTNNITDKNSENPETNTADIKTILVLAANPKTTSRLRLDEEVREIDAGLQRARKREAFDLQFDLQVRWAVRVRDVSQALLDFKPQIVHFCGHGGDDGLALEDETGRVQYVSTAALAELFELFSPKNNQNQKNIECVILNACYSEAQATAISQYIPYVIGMNKAIGDKAAIEFVVGFYSALVAGESIDFAYKLGCNAIAMAGIPENLTPILKVK